MFQRNKFSTDICTDLNTGKSTIACAQDIEKAFDTIWIDGHFYKIKKNSTHEHSPSKTYTLLPDVKHFLSHSQQNSL